MGNEQIDCKHCMRGVTWDGVCRIPVTQSYVERGLRLKKGALKGWQKFYFGVPFFYNEKGVEHLCGEHIGILVGVIEKRAGSILGSKVSWTPPQVTKMIA